MTDMAVELTELEKLEVTRVDAVGRPANGFPVLLMKGIAPEVVKGARDCPKCSKNYDADHTGSKCENCGTSLPDAPAAKALPDWHGDAAALVKKAMVRGKVDESADIDGGNQAIALVGKLIGYEAQELAAGNLGETADIEMLASAASLLRAWLTGESAVQDGNVMPATTLMQSAAEPAPEDTEDVSKAQIAEENVTVDTVDQEIAGQVAKLGEDIAGLTKALAAAEERSSALAGELAKVKAMPVPGGPVMTAVRPQRAAGDDEHAAKAVRFEEWALRVDDPGEAENYRQLAAQERRLITNA